MRGYSVLFVSAVCVFVLCGAAAVVAQDVTPEKAAEAASGKAKTAKEKGEKALKDYPQFNEESATVAKNLGDASTAIGNTGTAAGKIEEELPKKTVEVKKEVIVPKVTALKATAGSAKGDVEALKEADLAIFIKPEEKKKFTDKMTEVENKMKDVEKAVTDESSTIDAVITKAGELEKVAVEASGMWGDAVEKLTPQLKQVKKAFATVTTAETDAKALLEDLKKNKDDNSEEVKTAVQKAITTQLETSLAAVTKLQTALQDVNTAAGEAKQLYSDLAEEARKVKKAAEEKKKKGPQDSNTHPNALGDSTGASATQETEDYSAGPLCSLALPAFFFCWCVLFGM